MFEDGTNESLVKYLIILDQLRTPEVIDAFYVINREDFIPEQFQKFAYDDTAIQIGYSQTISQPQVVAFMLELLDAKEGQEVLDIGAGSGYTTALLSSIVGDTGFVTGLERVEELIIFGQNNLNKYAIKNATIQKANTSLGIKDKQFDRILVSAASSELPLELIEQLKDGGKLVIPIKNSIFLIQKQKDGFSKEEYEGFVFVPLIYE